MPFIPHTAEDLSKMLTEIGIDNINHLFDEIPEDLKTHSIDLPLGLSELAVTKLIRERALLDKKLLNFAGGGAYEHHIPAAVWQIVSRGEFYSSYTPYQSEASQGTLQVIYEFQSMICELLSMDCSNASLYDGATAAVEAVLMMIRINPKKPKTILVPKTLSPRVREVMKSLLSLQSVNIIEINFDHQTGKTLINEVSKIVDQAGAIIIPQPNYFGVLEDVDEITTIANQHNLTVIAYVNPLAMLILKPPGEWGSGVTIGADIAVGEAQSLGLPLNSGGPYLGIITCKQEYVRNLPGRIIGKTIDKNGRECFALTLQTREQHIRRAKATSNICSNQGLMLSAATIHMAIMGNVGLSSQASKSHYNLQNLTNLLANKNIFPIFESPVFHERAFRMDKITAKELINLGIEKDILAGVDLSDDYPELGQSLLICTTETKDFDDLQTLAQLF